jgi:hypothetical protein
MKFVIFVAPRKRKDVVEVYPGKYVVEAADEAEAVSKLVGVDIADEKEVEALNQPQ